MSDSPTPAQSAIRFGLIAGVIAYFIWGIFPIYFKLVGDVSATEIMAHRILWSLPFGALILTFRKQWPEVLRALMDKRVLAMLALAATTIAGNWYIYVLAVLEGRVLEASLGYYINPLMYVAAGVFIMGETLRKAQIVAVALAALGVITLTFGAGVFPVTSLILATSFTAYGYIRKTTNVGAMPGLFIEVCLLSPIALIYLIWLIQAGNAAFLTSGLSLDLLLIFAGPVTVIPLMCFALAARRLRLSTLGFLQYIGPTLQFALGLYFGEVFTFYHAICFGLIWIALAIFSFDARRASVLPRPALRTN
ncbi:EamA family transporter RarD [Hyphococcus formosus]|uniref:EamA family transporter RarD n=1 Tax=Hyphococcus formosus TaxID=3143534 RepID=UPI00398B4260